MVFVEQPLTTPSRLNSKYIYIFTILFFLSYKAVAILYYLILASLSTIFVRKSYNIDK